MSAAGFPAVHAPVPLDGTAYTVGGPLVNYPADERLARAYPMEALCSCGQMIRCEAQGDPWVHTGRRPGELG